MKVVKILSIPAIAHIFSNARQSWTRYEDPFSMVQNQVSPGKLRKTSVDSCKNGKMCM